MDLPVCPYISDWVIVLFTVLFTPLLLSPFCLPVPRPTCHQSATQFLCHLACLPSSTFLPPLMFLPACLPARCSGALDYPTGDPPCLPGHTPSPSIPCLPPSACLWFTVNYLLLPPYTMPTLAHYYYLWIYIFMPLHFWFVAYMVLCILYMCLAFSVAHLCAALPAVPAIYSFWLPVLLPPCLDYSSYQPACCHHLLVLFLPVFFTRLDAVLHYVLPVLLPRFIPLWLQPAFSFVPARTHTANALQLIGFILPPLLTFACFCLLPALPLRYSSCLYHHCLPLPCSSPTYL